MPGHASRRPARTRCPRPRSRPPPPARTTPPASDCCDAPWLAGRKNPWTMPTGCRPWARSAERDLGRLARFRVLQFQRFGRLEAETAGHQRRREGFALVVVGHHAVVVGLTREGDAVF